LEFSTHDWHCKLKLTRDVRRKSGVDARRAWRAAVPVGRSPSTPDDH
jgi:hypothetical protein